MKKFYKEFVIYDSKDFPIHPLTIKLKEYSLITKRIDLLSVFVENITKEKELKKIIKDYNYKEFPLKRDKIPPQNYNNVSIYNELIISRRGPSNKKCIVIKPGISFGYDHPATILTLKKLLNYKELYQNKRALDVGTGSGILSLVMAKLGAKKVIGLDICPYVVEEAINNVRKNRIKFKKVKVILKDISALKKNFSFIVANVPFNVHKLVSNNVKRLLSKGGALLLGGIMKESVWLIKKIYSDFQEIDFETLDDWSVILLKYT